MNNIELLKNYLDKDGKIITVINFVGGKYLCSYLDGTNKYLTKEQIFEQKKEVKIVEPIYFEEQIFENSDFVLEHSGDTLFSEIDKNIKLEEVPEDDFFKDFL